MLILQRSSWKETTKITLRKIPSLLYSLYEHVKQRRRSQDRDDQKKKKSKQRSTEGHNATSWSRIESSSPHRSIYMHIK